MTQCLMNSLRVTFVGEKRGPVNALSVLSAEWSGTSTASGTME